MAKEAGNTSTAGDNKICSDGRCGKNEYGDGKILTARDRVPLKELVCHGCR